MKRTVLAVILILALGGVLYFAMKPARISDKDNGNTVKLKYGQKLDVVLSGNPTTGYNWEIASIDRKVIRQNGEFMFKPATKAIGSPGDVTMHFIAIGKGSTALKIVYRRPWEKNTPPEKSYQVQILVE